MPQDQAELISRGDKATKVVIRALFQKITRTLIFSSGHTSTKRYLVFSLLHNKTAIIQQHVCQIGLTIRIYIEVTRSQRKRIRKINASYNLERTFLDNIRKYPVSWHNNY